MWASQLKLPLIMMYYFVAMEDLVFTYLESMKTAFQLRRCSSCQTRWAYIMLHCDELLYDDEKDLSLSQFTAVL